MTLNFYVSYLVPMPPERIAEIEVQMAQIIATVYPLDEAERRVARLQLQIEPERRLDPAVMRSHTGPDGQVTSWDCPRCGAFVASVRNGEVSMLPSCPGCGAEVCKEELPMSLDLFRLRTRRTDGVEVQTKPQA